MWRENTMRGSKASKGSRVGDATKAPRVQTLAFSGVKTDMLLKTLVDYQHNQPSWEGKWPTGLQHNSPIGAASWCSTASTAPRAWDAVPTRDWCNSSLFAMVLTTSQKEAARDSYRN